jgi:hypothetical protein
MKASNLENGKRVAVTHGELVLVPVSKMPKGETQEFKVYVASHSESGHNHVIQSDAGVEVLEGTERYILIKEVAKLFHQKTYDIHETRYLAPGAYKVNAKTEYNPFTKVIERVFD